MFYSAIQSWPEKTANLKRLDGIYHSDEHYYNPRRYEHFTISIKNYVVEFYIKSRKDFNYRDFKAEVLKGDSISFLITQEALNKIHAGGQATTYSVFTRDKIYLYTEKVQANAKQDSIILLLMASLIFFIILFMVRFIFKKLNAKN